jgi:preprotein translocase subunit YajC
MTAALAIVAPLLGAAAKKSSSSTGILVIYAAIAAAFYFLFYRPRQRKAKAAREVGNAFEVGDEVLTAGGIVGYVIDIEGDRVTIETSMGASFVVLRQYVIRKIEPPVSEEDDEANDDQDHQGDDADSVNGDGHGASDEAGADGEQDDAPEDDVATEETGPSATGKKVTKANDPDEPPASNDPPLI